MKVLLQKIDNIEFNRLCSLTFTYFVNGCCFDKDSDNILAFEFTTSDNQFLYYKVVFNPNLGD